MSISSEITRIQNKRDQSFTEVANKGVTVPAGSTIDDLPGLIAQIEQGSGSGSGGIIYQDLDGYLNLSEEEANVISIVDTLDTAGGTVRTITGAVENPVTYSDMVNAFAKKEISGDIVLDSSVTQFPSNSFMEGLPITSFRADGITSLKNYSFLDCSLLESISFPNLISLYAVQCFRNCTSLRMACFPKLGGSQTQGIGYFYTSTFMGCTSLEIADLNVLGTSNRGLNVSEFSGCTSFNTLILRKSDAICPLGNINVFTNSPFDSGGTGGTLYVPSALISTYQSATNWSTILGYANNQILAIEGSIYETQYADGTPIT